MEKREEFNVLGGIVKIALWGMFIVCAFPIALGLLALRVAANFVFKDVANRARG